MFDQFQNRELQSSTSLQKKSYIEITVENRCERILTFTVRLLITLGTIKSPFEMTGSDLWSKTWSKKQAAKHNSLKFFISHQCLQNKMLLTLLVFAANAILSPQFVIFSLSIVNDHVHLTWHYTSDSHMIVSQWRTEIGTSEVWLVLS